MGLLDDLVAKVADPYERQARLYPALLALLPLFVVVMLLYGPECARAFECRHGGGFLRGSLPYD